MYELEQKVRQWAQDRGIYDHSTPKDQALKLVEEVGEVCKAVLEADEDALIDGIGDTIVVLINLSEMALNLTTEACLVEAWNEIKNREGEMRNGAFVKK